jgi:small subunit ribosomal protein S16
MQRTGRINSPSYRLIVVEHTEGPKTGNIVEAVGTYDPRTKVRKIDGERVKYWMSVGAKASPTVHNMLISDGVTEGKKVNVLPKFAAKPAAEEAPDQAGAKAEAETPAVQ